MLNKIKSLIPVFVIILFIFSAEQAFADNTKVVVIPMASESDEAAGYSGQLQYNDSGKLAGADIFYSNNSADTGAGLLIHNGGDFRNPTFHMDFAYEGGAETRTVMHLTHWYTSLGSHVRADRLHLGYSPDIVTPQATLDIAGYAKLKSYSSPPVTCTSSLNGTIVMNDDYDLCVCRPALLGSAFKLVRDPDYNCW